MGTLKFYGFFPCVWEPVCVGTLSFYGFSSLCGGPVCVGTLRFYGFFPVCGGHVCGDFETLRFFPVWGVAVCGDFEILNFFPLCVEPCVGTLRFCGFFPCVWGLRWDFTTFSLWMGISRYYVFLPVCAAPVLETLKIFKKNPQYGKIPGVGI